MNLDWPEPDPAPLDWLYPTSAEAMRVCARRLAYQRDTKIRGWARGGIRSSLGIVAHAMTELVLSGAAPLEGRRSWLESKWNELLAGQHQKLQDQWPEQQCP